MVYVQVKYTVRPSAESVKQVRPVWLDIDQCGDSEYSIPAGYSDAHRDWRVTVPGNVMAMLGHVHGHGVAVEATNETRGGQSSCRSSATLDPDDPHAVRKMTTCTGDPLARTRSGDSGRWRSTYPLTFGASRSLGRAG